MTQLTGLSYEGISIELICSYVVNNYLPGKSPAANKYYDDTNSENTG